MLSHEKPWNTQKICSGAVDAKLVAKKLVILLVTVCSYKAKLVFHTDALCYVEKSSSFSINPVRSLLKINCDIKSLIGQQYRFLT